MSDDSSGIDPIGQIADSFVARYRKGERPSVEQYAAKHPELADEIRQVISTLVMMEEAKEECRDATQTLASVDTRIDVTPPRQLGDYRILREVGRGGMGVVYEALQESLGRRVALKTLPAQAALNERYLKRFYREVQAAARLHHTNIVPVHGVGEDQGVHYFAMQFVEGHGLDRVILELKHLWEDDSVDTVDGKMKSEGSDFSAERIGRSLLSGSWAQDGSKPAEVSSGDVPICNGTEGSGRQADPTKSGGLGHYWQSVASVAQQAADALDYAHAHGTVHRDVKPSNLLLDIHGNVWVTDFGLAKVQDQDNVTRSGDLLGTLRYMAPESLNGQSDARSDVYSLGLTLYELVALSPARDASHSRDLIRQARDGEVPSLRKVRPGVPHDLRTIVHKATCPEPSRRYQTAGEMAADLRRFLDNEPIHARRVLAIERLWRWCRRNPAISLTTGIAGLAILVTVLVAFLLVSREKNLAISLADEKAKLAAANAALAEQEREARDTAERSAKEAQAVTDFLVLDMIGAARPEINAGRELTVRAMLDRAAERVLGAFPEQPEKKAAIRDAIGRAYYSLGQYPKAREHLMAALKTRRQLLGAEHLATLKTANSAAAVLNALGEHAEGSALQNETFETLRRVFGPDHVVTLTTLGNLAADLHRQGKYTQARKLYQEVLRRKLQLLGPESENTLATMANFANMLREQGELAEAMQLYQRVLEVERRLLGPEHPNTLITRCSIATTLTSMDRYLEAETVYREVLDIRRRVLGPEHPATLTTIINLADNLTCQGKLDDARRLIEENLAAVRRVFGPKHRNTLVALSALARSLLPKGATAEAEAIVEELLRVVRRTIGAEHIETLNITSTLAEGLLKGGKHVKARELMEELLPIQRRVLGADHKNTLRTMVQLAVCYSHQNDYDQALRLNEEALEGLNRVLGPDHALSMSALANQAALLCGQEDYSQARELLEPLLERKTRLLGEENEGTLATMTNLGLTLDLLGEHVQAEKLYRQALQSQRRVLGPEHPTTLATLEKVALNLAKQGRDAEAEAAYRELLDILRRLLGPEHRTTLGVQETLNRISRNSEDVPDSVGSQ